MLEINLYYLVIRYNYCLKALQTVTPQIGFTMYNWKRILEGNRVMLTFFSHPNTGTSLIQFYLDNVNDLFMILYKLKKSKDIMKRFKNWGSFVLIWTVGKTTADCIGYYLTLAVFRC